MCDAASLLSEVAAAPMVELETDIFGLASAGPGETHYDRMGWVYDAVCGTYAYNRTVWGTTPVRSREFAERVFASRTSGPHVELGCGGLLFTAALYDEDRGRPCILIDPSIQMLRMARARLRKRHGGVPPYVALVQADGFRLPFRPGFAATVLSMHVLHVLEQRDAFLGALASLAAPGASTVGFTSLVHTGAFRDRFISALHRAGELASPITLPDLQALSRARFGTLASFDQAGQMAFVTAGG